MSSIASTPTKTTGLATAWRRISERGIFVAATAGVVIHIADDELVQRRPGTSVQQHLLAALVPIGVAAAAAAGYSRLRPGLRAAIALTFGSLAVVAGMIAVGGARADGISGSEVTGILLLPAGAAFLGLAAYVPWRERGRWARTRRRLWLNRAAGLVALPLLLDVLPRGRAAGGLRERRSVRHRARCSSSTPATPRAPRPTRANTNGACSGSSGERCSVEVLLDIGHWCLIYYLRQQCPT